MTFVFDEDEIRKAISVFHPDGSIFEIRLIDGKWNMAGIFRDAETLIDALKNARPHWNANVYMTLNALEDACYDRAHKNCLMERASPTISDNDVMAYEWLLVDVDPVRPAGTSSTNEQVKESRLLARKIYDFLRDRGWCEPVIAHSGNGTHLLYKVGIRITDGKQKTLMQDALKTLDMLFSTSAMKVDTTTFNPSRVCKLYGTVARKGAADSQERPHRMSRILKVPDEIKPTSLGYLQKLTELLPAQEKPAAYNNYSPGSFDMEGFLERHQIAVRERTSWGSGSKWVLEHCPFNEQHTGKDAAVFQSADGKLGFHCFHASCADKRWQDFRALYEPDAYTKQSETAPTPNYVQYKQFDIKPAEDLFNPDADAAEPIWRTTEEIRIRQVPEEEHIKTGIREIDQKMVGLKKGYVTVLSGLRSAGKSSILSQLVIQCREQGLKCALFSGEMNDKQVLKWLTLQAAGRNHVHGTQYERLYYPDDAAAEGISKWLDGYVYVYNNDYGNRFTELAKRLVKIITEKQLDMVLIDNLMALDVEDLDRDQYARQTKFVKALKRMAQALCVHILFVAHPRKSMGYLRMDDISGSGDLSNAADNVLIIHRVDEDFKKLTQQFFGWKANNPLYNADNVVEICKDRDFGSRDVYVPLYFEIETKRMKNDVGEYIHYGWEEGWIPQGAFDVTGDEDLPF